MADAWETLISKSTLPPVGYDAWEHLLAQGGEGGGPSYTILTDGLEILMNTSCFDVEIDNSTIEIELDQESIEIEIEDQSFEVEICDA